MSLRSKLLATINVDHKIDEFSAIACQKTKTPDVCYCTAFSNHNGSWPTFFKIWLFSIIATEPVLPKISVVYEGEEPEFLKKFPIKSDRLDDREAKSTRSQGVFNFWAKPQALKIQESKYVCWIDCDIILFNSLVGDLIATGQNRFVPKKYRVAGGFYCLTAKYKNMFLNGLSEVIVANQGVVGSDQKELLKLSKTIPWSAIDIKKFGMHLDKKSVKNPAFVAKWTNCIQKVINSYGA